MAPPPGGEWLHRLAASGYGADCLGDSIDGEPTFDPSYAEGNVVDRSAIATCLNVADRSAIIAFSLVWRKFVRSVENRA